MERSNLPKGIRGGTYILYGKEIANDIVGRAISEASGQLKLPKYHFEIEELANQIWESGNVFSIPQTYYENNVIHAFGEERFIKIFKNYIYYRTLINPKFKSVYRKVKKAENTVEITPDNILSFYSIHSFREEQRSFVIKGLVMLISSFHKDLTKMLKYKTYNTNVAADDIVIYDPRIEDVYMSILHGKRVNKCGYNLLKQYGRLKNTLG